jgi:hypothetical protein
MESAMKLFIHTAWGSADSDRFPGPQPISIERKHFPILKSQPYFVCEKSDGIRNMLVCFEFEGRKYCVLVNRAFEFQYTTLAVPRGTILDGELLDGEFLVYDAVCIKGEDLKKFPLDVRLAKAKALLIPKTPGNVRVRVKQMLPLNRVSEIVLGEKSDGLIFTPVNEPIRMGTHETLFKWKTNHTIDFIVQSYGDVDGTPCFGLYIQNQFITPLIKSNAQNKPPSEFLGKIVECEYGKNGWSIIKIRTDKTYPNNKRTYERTLVNIRECIKMSEFNL